MSIHRIGIKSNKMHIHGKWFETWIVTDSDKPPMVCLADFNPIHTETIFASGEKFETLPDKRLGVSVRCYCKNDVPSECEVTINLEQEGMTGYEVIKPNP